MSSRASSISTKNKIYKLLEEQLTNDGGLAEMVQRWDSVERPYGALQVQIQSDHHCIDFFSMKQNIFVCFDVIQQIKFVTIVHSFTAIKDTNELNSYNFCIININ